MSGCSTDGAPHVSFDVEYVPKVSGGLVGQYAAEIYPLRVDAHGTHQLSHTRSAECQQSTAHIYVIQNSAAPHNFGVQVARHAAASNEEGLFMPCYEHGAYSEPIDVTRTDDHTHVAASAAVVLHAYATTFTQTRQRCWTHVGTAIVPVARLMHDEAFEVPVIHNRDNDMSLSRCNPIPKGVMKISNARVVGIELRPVARYDIDVNPKRMQEAAKLMCSAINRGMCAFFGQEKQFGSNRLVKAFLANPTHAFLRPFHCPVFETDRLPVPASAYSMLMPAREPCVDYFEQLLEIALARSAMTRDDAERFGEHAVAGTGADHERYAFASLCSRAMSAFATSQCYLDDFLNRNVAGQRGGWRDTLVEGDEDFKVSRLCGGDDCEGVALEIHMHIRQLCAAGEHLQRKMSTLLRLVRDFLRLFVPTLTLGCVTNKKLTTEQLDPNAVMAHTFSVLLPFWQMYEMSGAEARHYLLDSRFFKSRRTELLQHKPSEEDGVLTMTAIVNEGTAPIDPAMKPVSVYYSDNAMRNKALDAATARRRVTQTVVAVVGEHQQQNLNIEVFGPPDNTVSEGNDYSPFYKCPASFATPEFADMRTLDWAYVYGRDSDEQRTFGMDFHDLVLPRAQSQNAGILPYLDFTEDEMRTIDAVLLDLQPIPALVLAPGDYRSPEQSQFTPELNAMRRNTSAPVGGTPLHRRFTFLTIRGEDVDRRTIDALRAVAALPVVRSFDFKWWILNAAVDGTQRHNAVLDVYLSF